MNRNFGIGLLIAGLICAGLIFFLLDDPGGGSLSGGRGEDSRSNGAVPASDLTPDEGPETTAPAEDAIPEAPIDPNTPPLLEGDVLGEGAGIPGAQVMLFSARRVESVIERLEERITALAGGGMPDVPEVLANVKGELAAFKRSAVIAETDENGHFEVRGIPAGGYFLLTLAPRWLFRYGDVVALADDRTEKITLDVERGAAIEGRVIRHSGDGISGVRVIAEFAPPSTTGIGPLVRRALQYVNGEFLKGPFEVVSGADGEFEIGSLPPGTYNITAYNEKGLESTVNRVQTGTTGVLVLYGDGATLVGTLVSPQGFPLAGIPMRLERIDQVVNLPFPGAADMIAMVERVLGNPPRELASGPDGGFAFRDLGAGRYRLSIETPGLNPHQQEVRVEWGEVHDLAEILIDPGRGIVGLVRGADGAPLAGAEVRAVQGGGNMMNGAAIMRDVMTGRLRTESRGDGSFELLGLRPATAYDLTASADGYASETLRGVLPDGTPVQFALASGRSVAGIVVRGDTGEGIANALVRSGSARTETDVAGRFKLDGVIPSASGSMMFGSNPGMDIERGSDAKIRVRAPGFLKAEETISIDRIPEELRVTLEPIMAIEGIVHAPSGEPMPGALVRLIPEIPDDMGPFQFDMSMIFFAVVVADLEGRFTMDRYFADSGASYQVIADVPGYTRGMSAPFSVGDIPQVSPLDVMLRLASTIAGTVTDGANPVAGAVVRLSKPSTDDDMQQRMFMQMLGLPKGGEVVHTDSEGRFRFEAHEPGEFQIGAEMVGFSDSPTEQVSLVEGSSLEFQLALDPGSSLIGKVTDDFGSPVAGAVVRLLQESGGEREMFQAQLLMGGAFRSTRTEDDGSYEMIGLPSGGYTVVAEQRGFAKAVEEAVYVSGVSSQNLSLVPSASLRGQVVDTATGEPISAYELSVTAQERDVQWGPGLESVSSPDGIFEREELDPGAYDVEVRAAGFGTTIFEIDLRPGSLSEQRIELERAGRLRGVVRHAETGAPVSGAQVALARPRDDTERTDEEALQDFIRTSMLGDSVETDSEGAFLLDTVPPGEPTIVVNHASFVQLRQVAPRVRRGEEIEINLVLVSGRTVSGVVRTESGAQPGNRFLILRGNDDGNRGVRKNTTCEEDGTYSFSGLEPGAYRIFAAGRAGQGDGTDVQVDGDQVGIRITVSDE